jgi:hypothetical protein
MAEGNATGTRDPQQIREEIEATRRQMGETVEALAAKADVKGRVAHKREELVDKVKHASPDAAVSASGRAAGKAREHPVPVAAAAAFAAGFVLGRISGR